MYTKTIPFKDFKGTARNQKIHFNLSEREVFKLLPELQNLFKWMDDNRGADPRDLSVQEVVEFYTNFENVMLDAWGEPSDDGLHFRKGNRYDFEESALFNATMLLFVQDPEETAKLLEGVLPTGLGEIIQRADPEQLAAMSQTTGDQQTEIAELRRRLAAAESSGGENNTQTQA